MFRRLIVLAICFLVLAGTSHVAYAANNNNNNDNGSEHHNNTGGSQEQDQNQGQAQAQGQKQLQGQLQGQQQKAVATGVGTGVGTGYAKADADSYVNVDSSDRSRTEYDLPVFTAAAIAASHCPNGGASAQWDKFGVSLGQHRDPVCARLNYKASLLAENTLLADVARLLERAPTARDPKGPTSDKITNSLATSVQDVILRNNVRIAEQNDAIEDALKPGWFDWMNEVPVLSVLAPNR